MEHLRQHWRKTANWDDISLDANDMRFYEWEGKQQRTKGGGRKINSAKEAAQLGERVMADYGIDPSRVSFTMDGWGSYAQLDGNSVKIKIGYDVANAWSVLHECAHAILFLRGNTDHGHKPEFERLLLELLDRYTRVRDITPYNTRTAASMKDRAYRGVPLKLDAGQGVPILQALVKGQRNVAARLIIDAMAMRAMDKQRWWSVGDHPGDEAGRWWTSSKSAAYDYASGSYAENWMTLPVVMTAEFVDGGGQDDPRGDWWWHLPAGHPLTIVKFEAALPEDPQALLDGWNGISSPGNFDHPMGSDGDFVDLPIPPMRTTATVEAMA